MKKLFTLLATIILSISVFSQAPNKISYQAVVRDASNTLVTNQAVGIKLSILQGSTSGTAVYIETHTPNTNTNGLFSIEIGAGTVVSGTFNGINWASGTYFIKTETDPTGGVNYTITGISQLISVPYAMHAKTAITAINDSVNDADADPNNELQNLSINVANDSLLLSSGNGLKLSDITAVATDNQNLSATSDSITISGGSGAYIGDIRDSLTAQDSRIYANVANISSNLDSITTVHGNIADTSIVLRSLIASSVSDDQNLSLSNDILTIEDGNAVSFKPALDSMRTNRDSLIALNTRVLSNQIDIASNTTNIAIEATTRILEDAALSARVTIDSIDLRTHINADGDLNSTNELQVIALSNDTLYLSDGGSVYLGAYAIDLVDDADADPNNEIQSLIFTNDSIKLTQSPGGVDFNKALKSIGSNNPNSPVNQNPVCVEADILLDMTSITPSVNNIAGAITDSIFMFYNEPTLGTYNYVIYSLKTNSAQSISNLISNTVAPTWITCGDGVVYIADGTNSTISLYELDNFDNLIFLNTVTVPNAGGFSQQFYYSAPFIVNKNLYIKSSNSGALPNNKVFKFDYASRQISLVKDLSSLGFAMFAGQDFVAPFKGDTIIVFNEIINSANNSVIATLPNNASSAQSSRESYYDIYTIGNKIYYKRRWRNSVPNSADKFEFVSYDIATNTEKIIPLPSVYSSSTGNTQVSDIYGLAGNKFICKAPDYTYSSNQSVTLGGATSMYNISIPYSNNFYFGPNIIPTIVKYDESIFKFNKIYTLGGGEGACVNGNFGLDKKLFFYIRNNK